MQGLRAPIICLRISSWVLFFVASMLAATMVTLVSYTRVAPNYYIMSIAIMMIVTGVGIGLWVELVIRNLRKEKRWAWIASIVTFSVYLPTVFIIPAIVGLTRMLRKDIREVFSKQESEEGL